MKKGLLPCTSVYDQCNKFSENHEEAVNSPHAHIHQTDAKNTSIQDVELILEKRL
jgi:hypothetical protein